LNPGRDWGWLALGALVANFAFDFLHGTRPVYIIFFFWAGNTLQAVLGAALVRRASGSPPTLSTLKEFAALVLLGGLVSTMLGALVGATTLVQVGLSPSFRQSWLVWWGSCAMPVLVFTPFIVVWFSKAGRQRATAVPARKVPEAILLFVVLILAAWYVMKRGGVMSPYKIWLVPVLLYAGLRFGLHGATGSTVLSSLLLALFGSRDTLDVFPAQPSAGEETIVLQYTLAAISLVGIVPAIVLEERKRAEAATRRSEELFRAVVEDQTEMIVRWKPDGTRTFVNAAYCRVFGGTPEQFIGTPFLPLVSEEDRQDVMDRIRQLTPASPVFTSVHRSQGGDGRMLWQEWTDRAIFDASGQMLELQSTGRDITARKQAEDLAVMQRQVLEMIATGMPMPQTLEALLRMMESQCPDKLCSIELLDPDGVHMRHGAAPSLPDEYLRAIDGAAIGPAAGSCGTAAYRRESVFVSDIASDPLWAEYRHLALPHGLRACWSTPIFDEQRNVLGTFAIYHREPGLPESSCVHLIGVATHTAAICIAKHRADVALKDSEERFAKAFRSGPDAILISDLETGRCVDANESFYQLFRLTPADTIGRTGLELGMWRDAEERSEMVKRLLETGSLRDVESRRTNREGKVFTLMVNAELVELSGRASVITTLHDITEQRQVQATLREAQLNELRVREEFARRLLVAQEEERRRLAGELHDSLGQNLSVIKNRSRLARHVAALPAEADHHLEAIERVVSTAIHETRSLAHNLRPPHIEQIGLTDSLEGLIQEVSQSGPIRYHHRLEGVDSFFEGDAATNMYRIVQEALNNLTKHSCASEASVTLERDIHCVRLQIADNGVGFDSSATGTMGGLGLTSIQERVHMLGGRLEIRSRPGEGTRLIVEVPISERAEDAAGG